MNCLHCNVKYLEINIELINSLIKLDTSITYGVAFGDFMKTSKFIRKTLTFHSLSTPKPFNNPFNTDVHSGSRWLDGCTRVN